jgi:hypothetical protein
LHFYHPLAEAYIVRLDEERLKSLNIVGGNSVKVPLRKKEIVTVELLVRK